MGEGDEGGVGNGLLLLLSLLLVVAEAMRCISDTIELAVGNRPAPGPV